MADSHLGMDRLERIANAYTHALQAGRVEEADMAVSDFMATLAEVPVEPTPELSILNDANDCEAVANWAGAEIAYRRLLARAEAEKNLSYRWQGHKCLAYLHGLLGRHGAALEQARAAVVATSDIDLPTMVYMALDELAIRALRTDRVSEALQAASRSLEQLSPEATYDLQRGSALVLRAACRTAFGEWPAAEADLEVSWSILEPHTASITAAAGAQKKLGRWWAVRARLRVAQGDLESAVASWHKAVVCRRRVAELPHLSGPYAQDDLARTLHGLGQALTSQGCLGFAEEAFAESRSLRQAVGLLPYKATEPTL